MIKLENELRKFFFVFLNDDLQTSWEDLFIYRKYFFSNLNKEDIVYVTCLPQEVETLDELLPLVEFDMAAFAHCCAYAAQELGPFPIIIAAA